MARIKEVDEAAVGAIVEEAGEIQQVVGKVLRHGWRAVDTHVTGDGKQYNNHLDLQTECGQMMGAIQYAIQTGLLDEQAVMRDAAAKLQKLTRIHG